MPSARILVIEDEFLVGEDIVNHLADMGYNTTGPVDNYSDACDLLGTREFDMALIDIKLNGEKDGIDLAAYIRSKLDIPIVFLSSLEHQSIVERAKSVRPSAYLLKPFNAKAVGISLEMALANHALHNNTQFSLKPGELPDALPISKYLFLRKESHYHRLAFDEILWLKADGNYTEFHTLKDRYVQTIQLSKVASRLPKISFKRVHRSYIVNLEAITGFIGNTLYINDVKIPVSSAYREEVFALFNSI